MYYLQSKQQKSFNNAINRPIITTMKSCQHSSEFSKSISDRSVASKQEIPVNNSKQR